MPAIKHQRILSNSDEQVTLFLSWIHGTYGLFLTRVFAWSGIKEFLYGKKRNVPIT